MIELRGLVRPGLSKVQGVADPRCFLIVGIGLENVCRGDWKGWVRLDGLGVGWAVGLDRLDGLRGEARSDEFR